MEKIPELQAWKNTKYNEMNQFIKKHEEAGTEPSPQQIQEFLNSTFKPVVNHWFLKAIGRFFTPLPVHAAKLIAKKRELDKTKAAKVEYKVGDKRTINGATYTFDGQFWED